MTVVLSGLSISLIISTEEMHQTDRLIPFVAIFLIHLALHWMLNLIFQKTHLVYLYILVQSILAVSMIYILPNIGLVLALSMALTGEIIGVFGISPRGVLAGVFYLFSIVGFYLWESKDTKIMIYVLPLTAMLVFVILYVEMYSRQAKSNDYAQQLLRDLEIANRQLTEYTAQVEDLSIAAERQRMARELHDTLSQGLAGMILQLEAADAHLAQGRIEKSKAILQLTMENARKTLADARHVIDNLRYEKVINFKETISTLATNFAKETSVPCYFTSNINESISPETINTLSKITAEALTNTSRHAKASKARILAEKENNDLVMTIEDDGCGFDIHSVPTVGHYGLRGIQERARLAGGSAEITSLPNVGTKIIIRIPSL